MGVKYALTDTRRPTALGSQMEHIVWTFLSRLCQTLWAVTILASCHHLNLIGVLVGITGLTANKTSLRIFAGAFLLNLVITAYMLGLVVQ